MVDLYNEFHYRYRETFVGWKEDENADVLPFLVANVEPCSNPDFNRGLCNVTGTVYQRDGRTNARTVKHSKLILAPPQLGVFNTKYSTVFVTARAERSARRGFMPRHCHTEMPFYSALNAISRHTIGIAPLIQDMNEVERFRGIVMREIFSPQYVDAQEAFNMCQEGRRLSVAITSKYWASVSLFPMEGVKCWFGYKKWIVGWVKAEQHGQDSVQLFPENAHLLEEASQYCPVSVDYMDVVSPLVKQAAEKEPPVEHHGNGSFQRFIDRFTDVMDRTEHYGEEQERVLRHILSTDFNATIPLLGVRKLKALQSLALVVSTGTWRSSVRNLYRREFNIDYTPETGEWVELTRTQLVRLTMPREWDKIGRACNQCALPFVLMMRYPRGPQPGERDPKFMILRDIRDAWDNERRRDMEEAARGVRGGGPDLWHIPRWAIPDPFQEPAPGRMVVDEIADDVWEEDEERE